MLYKQGMLMLAATLMVGNVWGGDSVVVPPPPPPPPPPSGLSGAPPPPPPPPGSAPPPPPGPSPLGRMKGDPQKYNPDPKPAEFRMATSITSTDVKMPKVTQDLTVAFPEAAKGLILPELKSRNKLNVAVTDRLVKAAIEADAAAKLKRKQRGAAVKQNKNEHFNEALRTLFGRQTMTYQLNARNLNTKLRDLGHDHALQPERLLSIIYADPTGLKDVIDAVEAMLWSEAPDLFSLDVKPEQLDWQKIEDDTLQAVRKWHNTIGFKEQLVMLSEAASLYQTMSGLHDTSQSEPTGALDKFHAALTTLDNLQPSLYRLFAAFIDHINQFLARHSTTFEPVLAVRLNAVDMGVKPKGMPKVSLVEQFAKDGGVELVVEPRVMETVAKACREVARASEGELGKSVAEVRVGLAAWRAKAEAVSGSTAFNLADRLFRLAAEAAKANPDGTSTGPDGASTGPDGATSNPQETKGHQMAIDAADPTQLLLSPTNLDHLKQLDTKLANHITECDRLLAEAMVLGKRFSERFLAEGLTMQEVAKYLAEMMAKIRASMPVERRK